MFFDHADEERTHGKKFISYLRHRGDADTDFLGSDPIVPILGKTTWADGEEALRDALHMEKKVTGSIKKIIDVCDNDQVRPTRALRLEGRIISLIRFYLCHGACSFFRTKTT